MNLDLNFFFFHAMAAQRVISWISSEKTSLKHFGSLQHFGKCLDNWCILANFTLCKPDECPAVVT
jgi:hypothetical protein